MSAAGGWLRRIALFLLVATLALAVVTFRVIAEGDRERSASDHAFDQGDLGAALLHARRAATLYAPGAPHVALAYQRLVAIALGSEKQGDTDMAERAWRAVRGAAIETRHLWVVEPHLLDLANDNLARLEARSASDVARARSEAQAWLERDETPRSGWVLLLGVGFAATLAGLAWICVRGVDSSGAVSFARIRWAGLLALIGLACWTLAVFQA